MGAHYSDLVRRQLNGQNNFSTISLQKKIIQKTNITINIIWNNEIFLHNTIYTHSLLIYNVVLIKTI